MIDQIGEEVIAVNVEIDQGLKHQNKKNGQKRQHMLVSATLDQQNKM